MKTMFIKILTAWGIVALTIVPLQAQDSEYFYLGEYFTPSRLEYNALAEKIDQRLENLGGVQVLYLFYSPQQRKRDSRRKGFTNIQLSFTADVTGIHSPQLFQCWMNVDVWGLRGRNLVELQIYDCKNSENIILPLSHVILRDVIEVAEAQILN